MSIRRLILTPARLLLLAIAIATAACSGSGTPTADQARHAGGPADAAQLFVAACSSCHGPLGTGGVSGVPLTGTLAGGRQWIAGVIRDGSGGMPAMSDGLSDDQIQELAEYVAGLR